MHDYTQLNVWRKSKDLAVTIYRATEGYPRTERFGLAHQTRTAAVSIPANIAEGCGRRSNRDLSRFLDIALGSAYELSSHIEVAEELGFLSESVGQRFLAEASEIRKMLTGLSRTLR